MSNRTYNLTQNATNQSYFKDSGSAPPRSTDVAEVIIERLNTDNGRVEETLSLQGTNRPFQPFTHPVSQEALRFYYPGGPPNRTPTIQILGSVDEDVVLTGRFKATKILDVARRNDPLLISGVLERFVRQGSPCRIQVGNWIKYVVLTNFTQKYITNSDIQWELRLMVSGDKNPISGEQENQESEVTARVFDTDETKDVTSISQQFAKEVEDAKDALSNYLPDVPLEEFSVGEYNKGLSEKAPVGGIVGLGLDIYDGFLEATALINQALNEIERFSNEIERASYSITRTVLTIQNIRSRLYQSQVTVFNSFERIKSSFGTFERLNGYNAIYNYQAFSNSSQIRLKTIEDSVRAEQVQSIRESYIVVQGDTLQSISTKIYGSPDRWEEIRDVNFVEGELRENQLLLIPA